MRILAEIAETEGYEFGLDLEMTDAAHLTDLPAAPAPGTAPSSRQPNVLTFTGSNATTTRDSPG